MRDYDVRADFAEAVVVRASSARVAVNRYLDRLETRCRIEQRQMPTSYTVTVAPAANPNGSLR